MHKSEEWRVHAQQHMAAQDAQAHVTSAGYPHTLTQEQLAMVGQQLATAAAHEQVPTAHAHMPAHAAGGPAEPEQDVMMSLSTQEQMNNLAASIGQHAEHHLQKPEQVSLPSGFVTYPLCAFGYPPLVLPCFLPNNLSFADKGWSSLWPLRFCMTLHACFLYMWFVIAMLDKPRADIHTF